MAKYLVTGGAGFIGSHLVDRLINQGNEVIVLDNLSSGKLDNLNPAVEFVEGDICDKELVQALINEVDGCFHLAAIASVDLSVQKWSETHEINLTGTINMFEASSKRQDGVVPIVYASSAAIYGDNASVPLEEVAQPSPLTPYGADKLGCEHNARIANIIHKVPSIGLRFFNVYGPRQDPKSPYSGVISIFVDRIKGGKGIKVYGEGTQTRDFVYVGDVVDVLVASMLDHRGECDVLNVCTGRSTSVNDLASVIASVMHMPLNKEHQPARSGDIHISLGSPEKLKKRLSVVAKTPLGKGLEKTIYPVADKEEMKFKLDDLTVQKEVSHEVILEGA